MSFDPRSLERLKELGRQLPKPLEPPTPQPQAKPQRQHRVEIEEDPEELFRQLMQVSPDGTVPEHLMARLRQLEAQRKRQPIEPGSPQYKKGREQGCVEPRRLALQRI